MTVTILARTLTRLQAPVPAVAAGVVVVSCGLTLVARPDPTPLLWVHLLQLALAGAAAFLLDDPVAELTGVTPPPLWRRRAPQVVVGLAVLSAAWLVVLAGAPGPERVALSLEVVVAVAVAVAASAVVARRGDPEPGTTVAPAVVLAGTAVLLVGGTFGFDAFVSGHAGDLPASGRAWVVVGVLAAGQLVVSSRDPAR